MNTIIRQIIDADKEARGTVEKAKQEKREAQNMLTTEKESIYAKFMEASNQELEEKKAELAKMLEAEKAANEKKYESSLISLQNLYEQKQAEWVDEIVAHCLSV